MTVVLPARGEPSSGVARTAWIAQQQIVERVQLMRRSWVELARELHEFDHVQHWRSLGYESFGQWMADPDVEIERSTGYLLVSIWRDLVEGKGADPAELGEVDMSKVQQVIAAVRRGQVTVAVALADCRVLSRGDLRERYAGAAAKASPAGRAPDTGSSLDADGEALWATCPACGSNYRVTRA